MSKHRHSSDIQDRIHLLTQKIQAELASLRIAHLREINNVSTSCEKKINELNDYFSQQVGRVQTDYDQKLRKVEEEMAYLKEMSESQRLMMESNIDYIRELELKYNVT